jgi:tRNA pseudouridine38-40 synthase
MRNIALQLAYDGTDFVGSQWQNNGRSVQGALEDSWEELTQERRRFVLSGRTDAGVHANGQVANVRTETEHSLSTIRRGLNAILPEDAAVSEVWEASHDFHARYSAVRREYRYLLDTAPVESPLLRRHVVHVRQPLDEAAMAEALALLVGQHDFAAFAASGPPESSTVRRCFAATCGRIELLGRSIVAIDLAANAFLRHMVRNIVGTVLLVGQRRMDIPGFAQVLRSRNRKQAGPTAPAHGLYLQAVRYSGGDLGGNASSQAHTTEGSA